MNIFFTEKKLGKKLTSDQFWHFFWPRPWPFPPVPLWGLLGQLAGVVLGGHLSTGFDNLTWQAVACQVIWRGAGGEGARSTWQAQLVKLTCQVPLVLKRSVFFIAYRLLFASVYIYFFNFSWFWIIWYLRNIQKIAKNWSPKFKLGRFLKTNVQNVIEKLDGTNLLYLKESHLSHVRHKSNQMFSSFDFNVAYSSRWGYSLINTLKFKKKMFLCCNLLLLVDPL